MCYEVGITTWRSNQHDCLANNGRSGFACQFEQHRISQSDDIARAILLACVPVAFFLGHLNLPVVLIISFLVGASGVLFNVSSDTLFVSLIPKERYIEANSLVQGSRAVAYLTGPGVGGILVQLLSAPMALLADAMSFIVSAICLTRIHAQEPPRTESQSRHVTAGLRFICTSAVIRVSTSTMCTINLFHSVFMALYVLYATVSLHLTPADVGIILGPGSVGAILGSRLAGRINQRFGLGRAFLIGAIVFTAPLMLVPLASGPHLVTVAILLLAECFSGLGVMGLDISNGAIRAAAIPDDIRSGVMGAVQFLTNMARTIGALIGASLPIVAGLHSTMWVATVGASLGFLWLSPSSII